MIKIGRGKTVNTEVNVAISFPYCGDELFGKQHLFIWIGLKATHEYRITFVEKDINFRVTVIIQVSRKIFSGIFLVKSREIPLVVCNAIVAQDFDGSLVFYIWKNTNSLVNTVMV